MRFSVAFSAVLLGCAARMPAQTAPDVRFLDVGGRHIRYEVRGGLAVVQGDIIIGTAAEVEAARIGKSLKPLASVLTFEPGTPQKWPNATMFYKVDEDIPNRKRITDGIDYWSAKTRFRMVERTAEPNYVHFVRDNSFDAACLSFLGMVGGEQQIKTTDSCATGNVIHELGHAWGLEHEQSRNDRNGSVTVLYQNMDKRSTGNFDLAFTEAKDTGYYDFGSVMHYGATAFARNSLETMETVPVGIPIGQRSELSAGDIDSLSHAYGLTPIATTITTIPSGLPITVDGAATVSPKSFDWAVGSTHTLTVATLVGAGDPRYNFVRWTDGGSASHTITADAGQTVYCAVYQTQHKLSFGVASGSGTVAVFPPTADGYYPERQPVHVIAIPTAGSQFIRWTGNFIEASGFSVSTADAIPEVLAPNTQYLATFGAVPFTTIDSVPHGVRLIVDGTSYLTPARFSWTAGSAHTLDLAASQTSGNNTVHYQFIGWDNGSATSARTVTAGATFATFTASFTTKYLLTTETGGPGRITVVPSSPDGYYNAGTAVQFTAVPSAGSALVYWFGDLAGADTQKSLVMDDQHDVGAFFNVPLPFSILNAASFGPIPQPNTLSFAVAPGEIITIFGTNLGPASLTTAQLDAAGNIAKALAGTRVLFDGVPAPIIYTSANQVSAVVPFAVAGKTTVRTEFNGVQGGGLIIFVTDSAPALFTANASGAGQIAALNQDNSINSPSNPAAPGEAVVLYATGAGQWTQSIPDGQIIGSRLVDLIGPRAPVVVSVGKLPAQVQYAGTAPGLVNGAFQINILLPKELIGGPSVPIQISVGSYTSPPGTTFAVK